ncbi:MAG: hypothetical protein Q8L88_03560 [Bacteroidota bacterium]|nr:hypothetical protein [Bacteroidota bacterium]
MKKPIAILMLFVYTVLTAGMTVIVHTCGEESETTIAVSEAKDPCACGDEMSVDMCCATEIKTVKIDDEQKVIATATIIEKLVILENLVPPQFSTEQFLDSGIEFQFAANVSPPPKTDITLVNSVFLI